MSAARQESSIFITSKNPATFEELGRVKISTSEDVHRAVAAARAVQPEWEALGFSGRQEFILSVIILLLEVTRDWSLMLCTSLLLQ